MILKRIFRRTQSARTPGRRSSCRLQLEALEDRLVMNNRFVVPVAQADTVSKFATLHDALTTPGLAAGDVIQIEPGSVPGSIGNADVPQVQNLTIRGDANVTAEDLPAFTVSDTLTIQQATNNLTLDNVHIAFSGGTSIDLAGANATITRCFVEASIVDFNNLFNLRQTTAADISDNTITCAIADHGAIINVEPANNSHNVISGNTIVNHGATLQVVVAYVNNSTSAVNADDFVVHNTIDAGQANDVLFIRSNINCLDIEDNVLTGNAQSQEAVLIAGGNRDLTIRNNRIKLAGSLFVVGLGVSGGDAGTLTSVFIADNDVSTGGQGIGMGIFPGNAPNALQLRAEGNDFHNNAVGVLVDGPAQATVSNIDLGGGTQHSLGGNNFRGFTAAATSTSAAIVSAVNAGSGDITARNNLFSVTDPKTVVFDGANKSGLDHVDASGNLQGSAALVQTLFLQFLRRAGDLNNPHDAGGWVSLLDHGTPLSTVVDSIARSPEALGIQVEQLYQTFLGRDAGGAEQAVWVSQIQHGLTLEAVTAEILTSGEYQSLFVDDTAFVRSLYRGLLHREGSAAEIASWVSVLPTIGRAGVVQGFLTSQEFRTVLINEDYAVLLHRAQPPAANEVNAWLAAKLDALTMDEFFATSPEYHGNG
jgi:hypothetical protein